MDVRERPMAGSVDRCRTVALKFVRFFVAEFEEQGPTTGETQNKRITGFLNPEHRF